MDQPWNIRTACENDIPALNELIPESVRGLSAAEYSVAQMDGALGSVFGIDRQLIGDGTYFVVEVEGPGHASADAERHGARPVSMIVGCGGWSRRRTLFGSDHHPDRDGAKLDPARDAARIRAFFVHPSWARRGIGRAILERCEGAIRIAGFRAVELASTLPGVPFYSAFGYVPGERSETPLPNGLTLEIVSMTKGLERD